MEVSFNSYYLYKKYEKRANQPWLPVYPETLSIDGDGTMPKVLKTSGDPACQPIYRLVETEDTICVEVFEKKYKLTLQDSSTVSAECDATSAVTSGEVATQYSGTVVSAEIGDCVKEIKPYAFYNCSALTSITISNGVTDITQYAFNSCTSLTGITIPNSVIFIGNSAFRYCSGLASLSIPTGITSISQYAFSDCSGLTSCTIPSSVTSINMSAFQNCRSLTSVTIPDSVTSIGSSAFYRCSGLTSVTIFDSVTNIGNYAFRYCTSLTNVTVLATTPPTLGSSVFNDTNNCSIYVPAASLTDYQTAWSEYSSRIQAII